MKFVASAASAFVVALGGIAMAQNAAPTAASMLGPDPNTFEIKTTDMGRGFFMLEGAAATNVTVAVGGDGIIMVDSMFRTTGEKLKANIAAKSKLPIKFVIDTHHHADAIGGTEIFAKPGTVVIGHEVALKRLSNLGSGPGGVLVQPIPKAARPTRIDRKAHV